MSRALHTEIMLEGEVFYLLPQKALYRPEVRQLVVSDVHLGKAAHFRKKGIAMPAQSHVRDIDMLHYLIRTWQPHSLLILGDLFHSDLNREWLWFKALLLEFPQVQFVLVEGNHDILPESAYDIPNLVKTDLAEDERFVFSHEPLKDCGKLNICGHVHPGVRIRGMARQSETLPCFYHDQTHFIMPAFGSLTGLYLLDREENATCYLVADHRVIRL